MQKQILNVLYKLFLSACVLHIAGSFGRSKMLRFYKIMNLFYKHLQFFQYQNFHVINVL